MLICPIKELFSFCFALKASRGKSFPVKVSSSFSLPFLYKTILNKKDIDSIHYGYKYQNIIYATRCYELEIIFMTLHCKVWKNLSLPTSIS